MRILFAEDDETIAAHVTGRIAEVRFLRSTMSRKDPRRGSAATAKNYDCVVLDLGLPGLDGIDIAQALAARGQSGAGARADGARQLDGTGRRI